MHGSSEHGADGLLDAAQQCILIVAVNDTASPRAATQPRRFRLLWCTARLGVAAAAARPNTSHGAAEIAAEGLATARAFVGSAYGSASAATASAHADATSGAAATEHSTRPAGAGRGPRAGAGGGPNAAAGWRGRQEGTFVAAAETAMVETAQAVAGEALLMAPCGSRGGCSGSQQLLQHVVLVLHFCGAGRAWWRRSRRITLDAAVAATIAETGATTVAAAAASGAAADAAVASVALTADATAPAPAAVTVSMASPAAGGCTASNTARTCATGVGVAWR